MDLKSLLNESGSMSAATSAQNEIESLKKAMDGGNEFARLQSMLSEASALHQHSFTSVAEQEAAKLLQLGTSDITGLTAGRGDSLDRLTRGYAESALGFGTLNVPKDPRASGSIDWEEMDRAAKERDQLERMNQSIEFNQHFIREAAEARRREDAKIDYARRSAEASEEVLAEERRKREAAEIATKEAKAEQDKAEQRAARAERREARMERWAIYAVVVTLVATTITAWPFLKEYLGW